MKTSRLCLSVFAVLFAVSSADAGVLEKLRERRAARQAASAHEQELEGEEAGRGEAALPPGVTVKRNVAYGADKAQRYDVYLPRDARKAPVIFMVHGGGWTRGDKTNKQVVENKVARWVSRGFIFISADYRMVPAVDPLGEANDVALALAHAQQQAAGWGGDPSKFIVMGHSAGAHLVTLLASAPSIGHAQRVLGTIALDSAAYDVEKIMEHRHLGLYDKAWGTNKTLWHSGSPIAQLGVATQPFLGVCSSRRTDSCAQAHAFAAKSTRLGSRMQVLEEDLSHKQINEELGLESAYTGAVEAFMKTLDPQVSALLP